jgi:hypothetical protein
MGFSLTVDRDLEIKVDARINITAVPAATKLQAKLSATHDGITVTHTGATKMAYTLPSDKQVRLQIQYVDANNNPAVVDGLVSWESSDEEIAAVEVLEATPQDETIPEGGVVMLVPGTKVGNAQVSAKADADLGEGMRELVTLLDITVVGGEAVAGTITPVGEPEDKP